MKNLFKKQTGNTYVTILIALIVIELVGLTLLSAIVVTNQANIQTGKSIISYRVAETLMETTISNIKDKTIVPPYYNNIDYSDGLTAIITVEKVMGNSFLNIIHNHI